jgi:hypothetical protein
MLVLVLLVIVAAVSWPYFDRWFQAHRLTQAVDTVRTQWVKARTLAMEEGRAYRFAWQAGSGIYRLAPDDLEHWPELQGTLAAPRLWGGNSPGLLVEDKLPEGVQFLASQGATGNSDAGWCKETIVFRPNGTTLILSTDGIERPEIEVALTDSRGRVNVLQLRGLTGVVTWTDLGKRQ